MTTCHDLRLSLMRVNYHVRVVKDLLADRYTDTSQAEQTDFAIYAKVFVVAAGKC